MQVMLLRYMWIFYIPKYARVVAGGKFSALKFNCSLNSIDISRK